MVGEVREPKLTYVTITGRLIPLDNDSYMELALLAYRFRKALIRVIKCTLKEQTETP